MNFFEQQEQSRKRTSLLILLFGGAVLAILAAVNGTVILFLAYGAQNVPDDPTVRDGPVLLVTSLATLLLIGIGSLWKIRQLAAGGRIVAEMVGGRPVDPATSSPRERQLINVVEEMAIASGTPVPALYVMDNQPAINAFAAGFTPTEAVIAVTDGTLALLDRDELQGVIAHEFSHIFNGDMRLNTRLMGIIHGILLIGLTGSRMMQTFGRTEQTTSRRFRGQGHLPLVALGVALRGIGYIGVFSGNLIKAAVSRQREFLADASAVQFTRNNLGIGGALKKIRLHETGSRITAPGAEALSHLYFADGVRVRAVSLLATHPPLDQRIKRLLPHWIPDRAKPPGSGIEKPVTNPATATAGQRGAYPAAQLSALPTAGAVIETVGKPTVDHLLYARTMQQRIPDPVAAAIRNADGAAAILFCLILDNSQPGRQHQLEWLQSQTHQPWPVTAGKLYPLVTALGVQARLPLIDCCLPALKNQSPEWRDHLLNLLADTAIRDQRVVPWEFVVLCLARRHLGATSGQNTRVRFRSLKQLLPEVRTLLSAIARSGRTTPQDVHQAFTAGFAVIDAEPNNAILEENLSLNALQNALHRLRHLALMPRMKVIQACAATVLADAAVTTAETEILRAICDTLDCPLPPLLERPAGLA